MKTIVDAAETILVCGEHQKKIINDILNVSKLDAGLLAIEQIPTQPHKVLIEAIQIFVPELKSKGISHEFRVSMS